MAKDAVKEVTSKKQYMAMVTYKASGVCKSGQFSGFTGTDKDRVVADALRVADTYRGPSYRYCDVEVLIGEVSHKAHFPVKYELVEI